MKLNKSMILVIFFGFLSISLIFIKGIPAGADFANHYRFAIPFYDELAQGNYFPGWLAESNNGFGDPRFRFYPPFLYYLLCLGKFLTSDWYASTLLVFTFFSIIGTLGTYLWARQTLSNQTAILAALIFAFIPYHLTQFYQASLLAEFAATALLPISFMFVERLSTKNYLQKDGRIHKSNLAFDVAGLSAIYSLIVVTHIPTTVVASLSLGVFALLLTNWKDNKKSLLFCALGIILGLISSYWFWLRMISELGWIQAGENVSSAYYDYRNNFLISPFALINLNTWFGNLLLALTIGYLLPTFIFWHQIIRRKPLNEEILSTLNQTEDTQISKRKLIAGLLIVVISIFMTTELSRPVWAIIPKLKDIQFPYRWLMITSVAVCPIIAMSLVIWVKQIKTKGLRPVFLVLLLMFVGSVIYTIKELAIESDFLVRTEFIEKIESSRGARSFNDWLPKNAKELKDLNPLEGMANAGKREITILSWGSMKKTLVIGAGDEKIVRIRTYNYPLWQAYLVQNGQKTQIATNSEIDGTLLVTIPPEKSEIEVVFAEPSRTIIAIWISIIGWLVIFGGLLQKIRKN